MVLGLNYKLHEIKNLINIMYYEIIKYSLIAWYALGVPTVFSQAMYLCYKESYTDERQASVELDKVSERKIKPWEPAE